MEVRLLPRNLGRERNLRIEGEDDVERPKEKTEGEDDNSRVTNVTLMNLL